MLNVNLMVNYSVKNLSKIKKLCDSLFTTFGISDFWYGKTDSNGNHSTIEHNIDFFDYYFSSKQYLVSPVFKNPHALVEGYYLYNNFDDKNFQESLNSSGVKYKSIPALGIVHRTKNNSVIRFGYGVDPSQRYKREILLNNVPLLNQFNRFFLHEAADILKGAEEFSLDLKSDFGLNFNTQPPTSILNPHDKCKFLASLHNLSYHDIQKLTEREITCLKHLYRGLTSQQISKKLFISPRTVEFHMLNIKNKLNADRKGDLFKFCELLENAGMFEAE